MEHTEDIESIKSSDIVRASGAAKANKTWFFERGDGMIFPAEEIEAWNILNNKSEWMRHDFKMLGVSDGKTYARIIAESIKDAKRLEPEIAKTAQEIERYRNAEENLIMNEAVDMEYESDIANKINIDKVLRLRGIRERQEKKLETLNADYRAMTSNVVSRAIAAELEVARGHFERPGRMDIITPDADPEGRQQLVNMVGTRRS